MSESVAMGSVAERLLDFIDTNMRRDTNFEIAATPVRNYSRLKELSIGEIADMCYVSKASLSRFCRFMGFADFKDMRRQLENDVPFHGIFPRAYLNNLADNPEGALTSLHEAICLNIATTFSPENRAKLPGIAQMLRDSDRVAFFSQHFLWDVGRYFQSRLAIMDRLIELHLDYAPQLACAQSLTENDLAIVCSIGGTYPIRYPAIANAISESGCRFLAITQNTSSSYWTHASCVLSCGVTNSADSGKYGALAAVDTVVVEYLRLHAASGQNG